MKPFQLGAPNGPEMERLMSKTNDTSRSAALEDHRPLEDSELALVSGGVTVKQKVVEH